MRYQPDLETRIAGIPAGVVLESYYPGTNHPITSASLEPNDAEEIEWFVVDRRGYPAPWLEDKLGRDERNEIESALIAQLRSEAA